MVILNKGIDPSKIGTVRIGEVLKSGGRGGGGGGGGGGGSGGEGERFEDGDGDGRGGSEGDGGDSVRFAECEEKIYGLEGENEGLREQVEELRSINESAKNELRDAIKSLQEAKKLEDEYKLLKSNYNKLQQDTQHNSLVDATDLEEQWKSKFEEFNSQKEEEILLLSQKLDEVTDAYNQVTLLRTDTKSQKNKTNHSDNSPSKYHYDLLKMDHQNTKDALSEAEKHSHTMTQKNVFEQERLLSENIALQNQLENCKRNQKLEFDSEKLKSEKNLTELKISLSQKASETDHLERALKDLELRIDEFSGVDSLMDAIRSRNLELETENEDIVNGLKSLNTKISILSNFSNEKKFSLSSGDTGPEANGKILLKELKNKFNEIQNRQSDLDGHLELYNKKTNFLQTENEDLKAELQVACKVGEELKMEVEVFEEHVEKMREAENQNL
jgi:chromosome segregation ATPase